MAIFVIIAENVLYLRQVTNGEKILQFSSSQAGRFERRDLLCWIGEQYPSVSRASIDVTLRRLIKQGILSRTKNGEYRTDSDIKVKYSVKLSDEISDLYHSLKELYPYTKFCIWNANAVSPLMHHVPSLDVILLETERIAMEPVFNDLSNLSTRRVLLKPTEKDYLLYASGNSCIIVKPLISESPLIDIDGINTPSLEKMLVDISIDPEFPYAKGSELYSIYENAGEKFLIDRKCMLRYASRRGKKDEINKLIESTML